MSVHLRDLPPDVRAKVEAAARGGSPSAAPRGSPRRRKTEGLEVRCKACGVEASGETAQARHVREAGHHRFEAVL